jgi:monoamine oxidase
MAGLVAARLLHDTGFSVTVLEARPRLGGRLWTTHRMGAPCDVGTTWIDDADENPLARWCRREEHVLATLPSEPLRFFENGQAQSLWRTLWQGRRAVARTGRQLAQARFRSGSGRSLEAALTPVLDDMTLRSADRRLLAWSMALAEARHAAHARNLDVAALRWPRPSGERVVLRDGFGPLLQRVAGGLDVRLSAPVNMLSYGDDGVTGRTGAGRFEAAAAVVTAPLGALQSDTITFNPPLPVEKKKAFERIGAGGEGALNKAVFRFPRRFWPEECTWLAALPPEDEARGLFPLWINLQPVTGAPLLMGLLSGAVAARLDRRAASRALRARGLQRLRRMFGISAVPDPDDFFVTRWHSDVWTRGSRSYDTPATRKGDRKRLAAPVVDRLFFAGEATHAEAPGTVEGALLSGERAARQVHARYCAAPARTDHLPWRE